MAIKIALFRKNAIKTRVVAHVYVIYMSNIDAHVSLLTYGLM